MTELREKVRELLAPMVCQGLTAFNHEHTMQVLEAKTDTIMALFAGGNAAAAEEMARQAVQQGVSYMERAEAAEARVAELEAENVHLRRVEAGAVRQADELAAMRGVVECLYLAGRWTCADLGPDREIEIWTAVRDAFGIKPGTATRISVAALTKAEG